MGDAGACTSQEVLRTVLKSLQRHAAQTSHADCAAFIPKLLSVARLLFVDVLLSQPGEQPQLRDCGDILDLLKLLFDSSYCITGCLSLGSVEAELAVATVLWSLQAATLPAFVPLQPRLVGTLASAAISLFHSPVPEESARFSSDFGGLVAALASLLAPPPPSVAEEEAEQRVTLLCMQALASRCDKRLLWAPGGSSGETGSSFALDLPDLATAAQLLCSLARSYSEAGVQSASVRYSSQGARVRLWLSILQPFLVLPEYTRLLSAHPSAVSAALGLFSTAMGALQHPAEPSSFSALLSTASATQQCMVRDSIAGPIGHAVAEVLTQLTRVEPWADAATRPDRARLSEAMVAALQHFRLQPTSCASAWGEPEAEGTHSRLLSATLNAVAYLPLGPEYTPLHRELLEWMGQALQLSENTCVAYVPAVLRYMGAAELHVSVVALVRHLAVRFAHVLVWNAARENPLDPGLPLGGAAGGSAPADDATLERAAATHGDTALEAADAPSNGSLTGRSPPALSLMGHDAIVFAFLRRLLQLAEERDDAVSPALRRELSAIDAAATPSARMAGFRFQLQLVAPQSDLQLLGTSSCTMVVWLPDMPRASLAALSGERELAGSRDTVEAAAVHVALCAAVAAFEHSTPLDARRASLEHLVTRQSHIAASFASMTAGSLVAQVDGLLTAAALPASPAAEGLPVLLWQLHLLLDCAAAIAATGIPSSSETYRLALLELVSCAARCAGREPMGSKLRLADQAADAALLCLPFQLQQACHANARTLALPQDRVLHRLTAYAEGALAAPSLLASRLVALCSEFAGFVCSSDTQKTLLGLFTAVGASVPLQQSSEAASAPCARRLELLAQLVLDCACDGILSAARAALDARMLRAEASPPAGTHTLRKSASEAALAAANAATAGCVLPLALRAASIAIQDCCQSLVDFADARCRPACSVLLRRLPCLVLDRCSVLDAGLLLLALHERHIVFPAVSKASAPLSKQPSGAGAATERDGPAAKKSAASLKSAGGGGTLHDMMAAWQSQSNAGKAADASSAQLTAPSIVAPAMTVAVLRAWLGSCSGPSVSVSGQLASVLVDLASSGFASSVPEGDGAAQASGWAIDALQSAVRSLAQARTQSPINEVAASGLQLPAAAASLRSSAGFSPCATCAAVDCTRRGGAEPVPYADATVLMQVLDTRAVSSPTPAANASASAATNHPLLSMLAAAAAVPAPPPEGGDAGIEVVPHYSSAALCLLAASACPSSCLEDIDAGRFDTPALASLLTHAASAQVRLLAPSAAGSIAAASSPRPAAAAASSPPQQPKSAPAAAYPEHAVLSAALLLVGRPDGAAILPSLLAYVVSCADFQCVIQGEEAPALTAAVSRACSSVLDHLSGREGWSAAAACSELRHIPLALHAEPAVVGSAEIAASPRAAEGGGLRGQARGTFAREAAQAPTSCGCEAELGVGLRAPVTGTYESIRLLMAHLFHLARGRQSVHLSAMGALQALVEVGVTADVFTRQLLDGRAAWLSPLLGAAACLPGGGEALSHAFRQMLPRTAAAHADRCSDASTASLRSGAAAELAGSDLPPPSSTRSGISGPPPPPPRSGARDATAEQFNRISNLPSFLRAEMLAASHLPHTARAVLQLLEQWAYATVQARGTVGAEGGGVSSDAASSARMEVIAVLTDFMPSVTGESFAALLQELQEELMPRLAVCLLDPAPQQQAQSPAHQAGGGGAAPARVVAQPSPAQPPLLQDFVSDILRWERDERTLLRASLHVILPALFAFRGGMKPQLQVLAWYLASDYAGNVVRLSTLSSQLPADVVMADNSTAAAVGSKRTARTAGASSAAASASSATTAAATSTAAAKNKRQRTIGEYSQQGRASGDDPLAEWQEPSSHGGEAAGSDWAASFAAMSEGQRRLLMARMTSSHAASVLVRLLLTPCHHEQMECALFLLWEHVSVGKFTNLLSDLFQPVLEALVWYLGEEPYDSPHNRAAAALRCFSHLLLGNRRRLYTPATYPTKRIKESIHALMKFAILATHAQLEGGCQLHGASQSYAPASLFKIFAKPLGEPAPSSAHHSASEAGKDGQGRRSSVPGAVSLLPPPPAKHSATAAASAAPAGGAGGVRGTAAAGAQPTAGSAAAPSDAPSTTAQASFVTECSAADQERIIWLAAHAHVSSFLALLGSGALLDVDDQALPVVRENAMLLQMPMELLLQRYLLLLLSKLSGILSRSTESHYSRWRALLVLQRLIVRVGGDCKLDKHVPSIMALLKLAMASKELLLPACAVWDVFVRLLSKETLLFYFNAIVVGLARAAESVSGSAPEDAAAHGGVRAGVLAPSFRSNASGLPSGGSAGMLSAFAVRGSLTALLGSVGQRDAPSPALTSGLRAFDEQAFGDAVSAAPPVSVWLDPASSACGPAVLALPCDEFGIPLRAQAARGSHPTQQGAAASSSRHPSTLQGAAAGGGASSRPATSSSAAAAAATSSTRPAAANHAPSPFDGCASVAALVNRSLTYLFVACRSELEAAFPTVPGMTILPALRPFAASAQAAGEAQLPATSAPLSGSLQPYHHAEEQRSARFRQRLQRLTLLLSSDSEQVQELTLLELEGLLTEHAVLVHSLIGLHLTESASPLVTNLVLALMEVNRRCSSPSLRLLCGACLGQVGAVDPSRMVEVRAYASEHRRLELQDHLLAVELIRTYLVKALRAAADTAAQDKIAYAIQQLLTFYGLHHELRNRPSDDASDLAAVEQRILSSPTSSDEDYSAADLVAGGDVDMGDEGIIVSDSSSSGGASASSKTSVAGRSGSHPPPPAAAAAGGGNAGSSAALSSATRHSNPRSDQGAASTLSRQADTAAARASPTAPIPPSTPVGQVSHAAESTSTGALPLPRQLERVLRDDVASLDLAGGALPAASSLQPQPQQQQGPSQKQPQPAGGGGAGAAAADADGVKELLEVLAPYWTSRLTIVLQGTAASVASYVPFYYTEGMVAGVGPWPTPSGDSSSSSAAQLLSSRRRSVAGGLGSPPSGAGPRGAPLRSAAQQFERWAANWARFLLDQLMLLSSSSVPRGRERLWDGCRTVVQVDLATTLFVLPYLVRDAVLLCSGPVVEAVRAEILAVLGGQDAPGGAAEDAAVSSSELPSRLDLGAGAPPSSASGVGASVPSGFHHRATQAVFSLLDTLVHWTGTRSSSASNAASAAADSANPTIFENASLLSFVARIPRSTLADAAFRIQAFARAYLYLETHLRETRGGKYGSARTRNDAGVIEDNAEGGLVSGSVPYLRNELAYLQAIYANIDDPDGMAGIGALRSRLLTGGAAPAAKAGAAPPAGGKLQASSGAAAAPSGDAGAAPAPRRSISGTGGPQSMAAASPAGAAAAASLGVRERMIDFEHEARWGDALMCYEQALQELAGAPRSAALLPPVASSSLPPPQSPGLPASDAIPEEELHAGMLRCLRNVGHLETALHRAIGVLGSRPDLAPVITPHAVEAAWRLGQWGPLQRLLAFQGDGSVAAAQPSRSAAPPTSAAGTLSLNHGSFDGMGAAERPAAANMQLPRQRDIVVDYETCVGSALLHLHFAAEAAASSPPAASAVAGSFLHSEEFAAADTAAAACSPAAFLLQCAFRGSCEAVSSRKPAPSAQDVPAGRRSGSAADAARSASVGAIGEALQVSLGAERRTAGLLQGVAGSLAPRSAPWVVSSAHFLPPRLLLLQEQPGRPAASAMSAAAAGSERDAHVHLLRDALATARRDVMTALAAASSESYTRAYPCLLRLHCLREVERCLALLPTPAAAAASDFLHNGGGSGGSLQAHHSSSGGGSARERMVASWEWDARLRCTSPALSTRESILALRRALFRIFNMRDKEAAGWLELARSARSAGNYPTATAALLHAAAQGSNVASLQRAKLLYAQGAVHRALQELEPTEKDVDAVAAAHNAAIATASASGNEADHAAAVRAATLEAKRVLYATSWMVESRLVGEAAAVNRFSRAISLNRTWEKAHFYLGRYYDGMLHAFVRAAEPSSSSDGAGAGGSLALPALLAEHAKTGASPGSGGANSTQVIGDWMRQRDTLLLLTVVNYGNSLRHGHAHIFQSLPRILTLYFDYGASCAAASGAKGWSTPAYLEAARRTGVFMPQEATVTKLTAAFRDIRDHMMGYRWMTVLPQMISRICHRHPSVSNFLMQTLSAIMHAFPQQASWAITGLRTSRVAMRVTRAQAIHQMVKAHSEDQRTLNVMHNLFDELIRIACERPPNTERYSIAVGQAHTFNKYKILLPLQSSLTVLLPRKDMQADVGGFPTDAPLIERFDSVAEVMASKERPKKIAIFGRDGRRYNFLVKQEQRGDLRKDARMMESGTLVNRLLCKTDEGRRRRLLLRTYAVNCLNEECGLMQWVQNTAGLRPEVTKCYAALHLPNPSSLTKQLRTTLEKLQAEVEDDYERAVRYRAEILVHFPAVFHRWFAMSFADPSAWFEARLAFARSAAVWSMVGHVVGLGDRHGENVLVDRTTGECVHVDFDCLFDKGMTLTRPEIVPFRLSPNMLDGMGLAGYEGVFRRCSEVTMGVLRANKDMLLSVLESFIHDPLVEWARRSTRPAASAPPITADGRAAAAAREAEITSTAAGAETENQDGVRIIRRIAERLDGQYNAGVEFLHAKNLANSSRYRAASQMPRYSTSSLAIPGQVHRLIKEAVSDENAAGMYIGWMAFV